MKKVPAIHLLLLLFLVALLNLANVDGYRTFPIPECEDCEDEAGLFLSLIPSRIQLFEPNAIPAPYDREVPSEAMVEASLAGNQAANWTLGISRPLEVSGQLSPQQGTATTIIATADEEIDPAVIGFDGNTRWRVTADPTDPFMPAIYRWLDVGVYAPRIEASRLSAVALTPSSPVARITLSVVRGNANTEWTFQLEDTEDHFFVLRATAEIVEQNGQQAVVEIRLALDQIRWYTSTSGVCSAGPPLSFSVRVTDGSRTLRGYASHWVRASASEVECES